LRAAFIWEGGYAEKNFTRGSMIRWCVPVDDDSCLAIGFRLFNEQTDPNGIGSQEQIGKDRVDLIGQTGERPYEERQRIPGDYDAQVSQRPIALHALEHLQGSDRGIAMMRRMIREGQQAVGDGEEPRCVRALPDGGAIPTYGNDSVIRIPQRPGADDDRLLWEVSLKVADIIERNNVSDAVARQEQIVREVAALSEPA
jgi:hypothetical protein